MDGTNRPPEGKEGGSKVRGQALKELGVKKEDLMQMIAQEMVTSLLGEGGEGGDDDEVLLQHLQERLAKKEKARRARKKAKKLQRKAKKIARDMRRGTIPEGTAQDYYSRVSDSNLAAISVPGAELEVSIRDDSSFAGDDLEALVDPHHRVMRSPGASQKDSYSESAGETLSTGSFSNSREASASSNSGGSAEDLSIDEIKRYVMENIPQGVRNQIPEEAWAQIFNPSTSKSSKETTSAGSAERRRVQIETETSLEEVQDSIHDEDDNMTAISDISGLTSAFPDGRSVEHRLKRISAYNAGPAPDVPAPLSRIEGSLDDDAAPQGLAPQAPGESSEELEMQGSSKWSIMQSASITDMPRSSKTGVAMDKIAEKIGKKVDFDQVDVRYYERIVTDNPAVQSGPAIGIGWRYKRGGRVDVDYWEQSRGPPRRSDELVLPREVREGILRDVGYTQNEIAAMVRSINKTKNRRKQTVNNLAAADVEEAVESARRRMAGILRLGRRADIVKEWK